MYSRETNCAQSLFTRGNGWSSDADSFPMFGWVMSKDRFHRLGGGVRALKFPPDEKFGHGDASRVCG